MDIRSIAAVLGSVLLALVLPAVGHHSNYSVDTGKTVSVTGKLVKLEWGNPHAWAYVEVPAAEGAKTVTWAGELGNPNMFYTQGWTEDKVKALVGQPATSANRFSFRTQVKIDPSVTELFWQGAILDSNTINLTVAQSGAGPRGPDGGIKLHRGRKD